MQAKLELAKNQKTMSKTSYPGLDYGLGRTNIDTSTGIRFGVIPHHAIGQAWYEASEPFYGSPHCPKCGNEASMLTPECADYEHARHECAEHACHRCEYVFGSESAFGDEPKSHYVDSKEISAEQSQDSCDIFVVKSLYFTRAQFCSPCAPGACYLLNSCDSGERAYCFGHDWFESGQAPYPVFSVATGERIFPELGIKHTFKALNAFIQQS